MGVVVLTLVVVFNPENPVVISDVLLSAQYRSTDGFMPNGTPFFAADFPTDGLSPHSFTQKMIILKDGAVLALVVGEFDRGRMVVDRLRDAIKAGLTIDGLNGWLSGKSAFCGKKSSVIICWIEDSRYVVGCAGPIVQRVEVAGTTALFSGSGSDWFLRLPIRLGRVLHQKGNFDPSEYLRMQAVAQGGFHLLNERVLRTNSSFGGGFQTAYYDGLKFRMSDDITYLMWKVDHDDNGKAFNIDLFPQIVVQRYEVPDLCFDVADLTPHSPLREEAHVVFSGEAKLRRTIVPSLLRQGAVSTIAPRGVCTTPIIDNQVVHVWNGHIVHVSGNQLMGDPTLLGVQIRQDGDRYELTMSREIEQYFDAIALPTDWKERAVPLRPKG